MVHGRKAFSNKSCWNPLVDKENFECMEVNKAKGL
ncbi:hypothetical protein SLEP1_g25424 [Rubroshorea leprosula]|uniref:Uncharacterized protein n=1 Tax=Rubroshorea leprosula TaxID=152421 RepID=A0AAV5JR25_9ROSI|nr:hypothetical protein SLEP1_g25424 [Rubroshorea leprosula]